jgi:hypothetical protein
LASEKLGTKSIVTLSSSCCTTKMDFVRLRAWAWLEELSLSTLVSMRKTFARSSIFDWLTSGIL